MEKKLFLLDGMALAYRAHFALIARPIFTSKGVNSSALFGFTQTLLDILKTRQPSHMAVVFDTEAPTQRHKDFAEYKAHREAMPEELSQALPHIKRMIEAFRIPVVACDGWEADDVIGTLAKAAEREDFTTFMVTPDKDFGQLVSERTFLYRPSRAGDGVEILGVPEVLKKWSIERVEQVVDLLALMGDSSDNIPGVPGIGEKTAAKLLGQFGTVENLLARTAELKGKLKETVESHREDALLSKKLATIDCCAPCGVTVDQLEVKSPDAEALKQLFIEFEFNSIGRRVFGEEFKAGRGLEAPASGVGNGAPSAPAALPAPAELSLGLEMEIDPAAEPVRANLKTLADVQHDYRVAESAEQRRVWIETLRVAKAFAFATVADGRDAKSARLLGIGFSTAAREGFYLPLPEDAAEAAQVLEELRPVFESEEISKMGHDLKFDLGVLRWRGIAVRGKLFDAMIAHSLIEPDLRHSAEYLSEVCLGYTPVSPEKWNSAEKGAPGGVAAAPAAERAEFAAERADVAGQLRGALEPLLRRKGQERVFYEIEAPLIPVLAEMEFEGVKVDAATLAETSVQLGKAIGALEKGVQRLAGQEFNLNSTRQLGVILFETLKIAESPKKTKTGLYSTDEQTLLMLAPDHEIVRLLLEYRELSKLKSTYVDALPTAIWPATGRIHTTFQQAATATGRLNSQNPNLQNIPIRSEQGKEIRKAFVPRDGEHELLSADYSQIELRIIAALSREEGLLDAFRGGGDVHTATAARVFGVTPENVTGEMRRKAKMVNYGIAYGISAFGLAQRLGIPRKEAAAIIDQYFAQFAGIRKFMNDTIAFARSHGYVETVTGRRRYLRDIRSANATIRAAAERNAINAPIQGTAADMIKLAMSAIHRELASRRLRTRMMLQVHDELVFDLYTPEKDEVMPLVEEQMKRAIALDVPIVVEMGAGRNWLEAH